MRKCKTIEERFWGKVQKGLTPDCCWLWYGGDNGKGYGTINIKRKMVYVHRLSYEWSHGDIPEGLVIDHTCHVRNCVNPRHLRAITQKQNLENIKAIRRDNTSGYRGVSRHQGRWVAEVWHNKRKHFLGSYDTPEDAAEVAKRKRLELFSHNDVDR